MHSGWSLDDQINYRFLYKHIIINNILFDNHTGTTDILAHLSQSNTLCQNGSHLKQINGKKEYQKFYQEPPIYTI